MFANLIKPRQSWKTTTSNINRVSVQRKHRYKPSLLVLEERVCPSVFYDYEILAQTGQDNILSIQPAVSINDAGHVAFVASQTAGQSVYFGNGSSAKIISSPTPLSTITYGQELQINNDDQVAAVSRIDFVGGNGWVAQIWDSHAPGTSTIVGRGSSPLLVPSDFDSLGSITSMTNDGQLAFAGFESDEPLPPGASSWEIHLADGIPSRVDSRDLLNTEFSEVTTLPSAPAFFRFMAADGDRMVVASRDSASGPKRIMWYVGTSATTIATTNGGLWSDLGVRAGISDDGSVVAFYGDLSATGAAALNLTSGKGIFVSVRDSSTGAWVVHRIAGLAGNGKLDPGETFQDTNGNGTLDAGETDSGTLHRFTDFDPDTRVAVEYKGETKEALTVVFTARTARNEISMEGIYSASLVKLPSTVGGYSITSASEVLRVGDTVPGLGVVDDVAMHDAVNKVGQVAVWAKSGSSNAIVRGSPVHTPVIIVPGVVGSFGTAGNYKDWLLTRGIDPTQLIIDPLGNVYADLIQTFDNAGYDVGKDLFIATYDWRLPVAPADGTFDGTFDGVISGISAESITSNNFEYGVDYLGYWLKEAVEAWNADPKHAGRALPSVDVVAHSMGGLVTRSYIQSGAYGATYASGMHLPKIDNFVMFATPNEGATKAYNPFVQDNWNSDPTYKLFLSKFLKNAYHMVVDQGLTINGPQDITLDTLKDPATGLLYPDAYTRFIAAYVPSIRDLIPTFEFLDDGSGLKDINSTSFKNSLLLDLNNGLNFSPSGDLSSFADSTRATTIYGTSVSTITQTQKRIGTGSEQAVIAPFDYFAPPLSFSRPPSVGEVWYEEISAGFLGDGTVPLNSLRSRFDDDDRFRVYELTGASVSHTEIVSQSTALQILLRTLGLHEETTSPAFSVSTGLSKASVTWVAGTVWAMIFDPVEAVLVDDQGRRLGFSSTEGVLNEIPDSDYFGDANGFGIIRNPAGTMILRLTGLGENYFVAIATGPDNSGLQMNGFLATGETKEVIDIGAFEGTAAFVTISDGSGLEDGIVDGPGTQHSSIRLIEIILDEPIAGVDDGATFKLRNDAIQIGDRDLQLIPLAGGHFWVYVRYEVSVDGPRLLLTLSRRGHRSLGDGDYDLRFGAGFTGVDDLRFHRLFGDVDGDHDVDSVDRAALEAAWRSRAGDAEYRSYLDAQNNGFIGAGDRRELNKRFLRFVDEDGDKYRIRLRGPLFVNASIADADGDGQGGLQALMLSDTDPNRSRLRLLVTKARGGDGLVSVNAITGGGLRSLGAARAVLSGDGIDLTGPLGTLELRAVVDSSIRVRSVREVALRAFLDSIFFAGYLPASMADPMAGGDFTSGGFIDLFRAHGLRGDGRSAFENSTLAAKKIGRVILDSVAADNGGAAFGVLAKDSIRSVRVDEPRFRYDDDALTPQAIDDFQVILAADDLHPI